MKDEYTMKKYDVVIIGGGPAGLTASIYLGRENYRVLIIERGVIGGIMATIPRIDNYPGLPSVSGVKLAEHMWSQAESFGVDKVTAEVEEISKKNDSIEIITNEGKYESRSIIIATGGSYRKLNIEGEEYAHYCATCDGPFYKDKKLVVVGGANSAFISAIFLSRFAREVLIAVRNEISADKVIQDDVEKVENIIVKNGLRIRKVISNNKKVQAVEFDKETIETDGVFIFAGHIPSSGLVAKLDIKLDEHGYIKTDENLMTAPGVFVAGDIRSDNVKQIVVATGEGAVVAKKVGEFLKK